MKQSPWKDKVTKVLLAGLGAVVFAEEEAVKFIRSAVQKGALGKGEGEEILRELLKKKQTPPISFEKSIQEQIRIRLEELDLPTRQDILQLNQLLESLLEKISLID